MQQICNKFHYVTQLGSTLAKAIGLTTLKDKKEHFDEIIFQHTIVNGCPNHILQHGTDNEINGVSTLLHNVLPAFYPKQSFVEEGCYVIERNGDPFIVVSPDGNLRTHPKEPASMALEIKCPYPDKTFTTQQHYKIPKRYVSQLLAEMTVLSCDQLLYICYTEESTTIFIVKYDRELWQMMVNELGETYNENPKRPTKTTSTLQLIQQKITKFLQLQLCNVCMTIHQRFLVNIYLYSH